MIPNIKIFYHVTSLPRWQEIGDIQLTKLRDNNLLDIAQTHVTLHGNPEVFESFKSKWDHANIHWHTCDLPLTEGEHPTFIRLQQTADASHELFAALYLQQKGVSYSPDDWRYNNCNRWREYLEWFCINKWRDCVTKLGEGYDCAGTEWWPERDVPANFAGTVSWVRSDFVKKCQPKLLLPSEFGHASQLNGIWSYRHDVEFYWGVNQARAWSAFNSNRDLYHQPIMPEEYENVTIS